MFASGYWQYCIYINKWTYDSYVNGHGGIARGYDIFRKANDVIF